MNKINPVTILGISFIVLLSSLLLLKQSEEELIQKNKELAIFNIVSNKYVTLKSSWDQKEKSIKLIDKVLSNLAIKNISKQVQKRKMIIKIKNEQIRKIDKFINKILNSNLNILKLNITDNSIDLVIGY